MGAITTMVTKDSHRDRVLSESRKRLVAVIYQSGVDSIPNALDSSRARAYLFAGAVRDALLSVMENVDLVPKDFDIGIRGTSKARFVDLATRFGGEDNRYGGYRIRLRSGACVDLWRIEETAGVRINAQKPIIDNVLRSFVLSVNAVGFDLRTYRIVDMGALASIRRRRIDLLSNALLHSRGTFAARAILLSFRFSFKLSVRLQNFIRENFDRTALVHEAAKLPENWVWHSGPFELGKKALPKLDVAVLLRMLH